MGRDRICQIETVTLCPVSAAHKSKEQVIKNVENGCQETLIIDATGVGFGGLTLFLDQLIRNLSLFPEIVVFVLGAPPSIVEGTGNVSCLCNKSGFKLWRILQTFLKLIILRRNDNATLYSISPSVSALAWYQRPMVQNFNDFQSFNQNIRLSFTKRTYRRLVYRVSIHLASSITCISQTTKSNLLAMFKTEKAIKVIELSGEIPMLQVTEEFDFLVIAHSSHKNAGYVLELMSQDSFLSQKRIAVLGKYLANDVSLLRTKSKMNLKRFEAISEKEYIYLINSSKVIVMNSEIGTEGFGLPIAQAIFLGKSSVISQDPALIEIGENCSIQLTGTQHLDREILKEACETPFKIISNFKDRAWFDVVGEIVGVSKEVRKKP